MRNIPQLELHIVLVYRCYRTDVVILLIFLLCLCSQFLASLIRQQQLQQPLSGGPIWGAEGGQCMAPCGQYLQQPSQPIQGKGWKLKDSVLHYCDSQLIGYFLFFIFKKSIDKMDGESQDMPTPEHSAPIHTWKRQYKNFTFMMGILSLSLLSWGHISKRQCITLLRWFLLAYGSSLAEWKSSGIGTVGSSAKRATERV